MQHFFMTSIANRCDCCLVIKLVLNLKKNQKRCCNIPFDDSFIILLGFEPTILDLCQSLINFISYFSHLFVNINAIKWSFSKFQSHHCAFNHPKTKTRLLNIAHTKIKEKFMDFMRQE